MMLEPENVFAVTSWACQKYTTTGNYSISSYLWQSTWHCKTSLALER